MILFKSLQQQKLSYCILRNIRKYSSVVINEKNEDETPHKAPNGVLYNSVVNKDIGMSYIRKVKIRKQKEKLKFAAQTIQPFPIAFKYVLKNENLSKQDREQPPNPVDEMTNITQFPYSQSTNKYSVKEYKSNEKTCKKIDKAEEIDAEIRARYKNMKEMKNWMNAYDNYEYDLAEAGTTEEESLENVAVNYGTPDPKSNISKVPCGGCGALLHCKEPAIPGYIPSEIFKNHSKKGGASLESIMCQRCHFLKEYNIALQVQVRPEDYANILKFIPKKEQPMILLMVDLTDFPCSIWPGIADILGPSTPIYVVGNKVDLLPKDDKNFLKNVQQKLLDELKLNGFGSSNILGISLISAKTDYGIEDLITALFSKWARKGDVYLVGCTNVGKSSLFNALIQSDFCKSQVADLIQRATVSQWPGTTLNLLKFPILRPSKERLFLRQHRLQALNRVIAAENVQKKETLKVLNNTENATLIGYIDRTYFHPKDVKDVNDEFSTTVYANASGKLQMGIDEKSKEFAMSRWCYDTPGVIQPDQILNILTIDELLYVLPKELIRPETFGLRPGSTLFIAGLARLDYLEGPSFVRLTVFRSNLLPITACSTDKADEIYERYLGTEFFQVPINNGDRLSKWPGLTSKVLKVTCINPKESSKDIVLSNAGWVAVNSGCNGEYTFQAWTPEGRGIHLRDCLLPKTVQLRGKKIRNSVVYLPHRFI